MIFIAYYLLTITKKRNGYNRWKYLFSNTFFLTCKNGKINEVTLVVKHNKIITREMLQVLKSVL